MCWQQAFLKAVFCRPAACLIPMLWMELALYKASLPPLVKFLLTISYCLLVLLIGSHCLFFSCSHCWLMLNLWSTEADSIYLVFVYLVFLQNETLRLSPLNRILLDTYNLSRFFEMWACILMCYNIFHFCIICKFSQCISKSLSHL